MPYIFWDSDAAKWIAGVNNEDDLKSVAIDPKGDFTLTDREFLQPPLTAAGRRPGVSDALYSPTGDDYALLQGFRAAGH